jgi:hypothetical protein
MNRHVPPFARVILVREQLAHEIFQREASLLEDSSLSVLTSDHVFWSKCSCGANSDSFFTSGNLLLLGQRIDMAALGSE